MDLIKYHKKGQWFLRKRIPFIPGLVKRFIFIAFNCDIPFSVNFKKGTYLYKGGMGVIIHGRAQIGEYVAIGSHVTIGGNYGSLNVPRIGNEVLIAPGVAILGDINIGDNVIIGANSVVIKDVPSNTVVGGIPAKELKKIEAGYVKNAYFSNR
jgi:serine O-acetyltransferase